MQRSACLQSFWTIPEKIHLLGIFFFRCVPNCIWHQVELRMLQDVSTRVATLHERCLASTSVTQDIARCFIEIDRYSADYLVALYILSKLFAFTHYFTWLVVVANANSTWHTRRVAEAAGSESGSADRNANIAKPDEQNCRTSWLRDTGRRNRPRPCNTCELLHLISGLLTSLKIRLVDAYWSNSL